MCLAEGAKLLRNCGDDAVAAGHLGAGASGQFQECQCASAALDARTGQHGKEHKQMKNEPYYGLTRY